MNTASYPSEVQTWPEAATVVVSGLLGVLAAALAVLLLSDEGAPDAPPVVEVVEVHPDNLLNV